MRNGWTLARQAMTRGARDRGWRMLGLSLGATVLASLAFWLAPGIDIGLAGLFHRAGDGFALATDPALKALRRSSTLAQLAVLLTVLALMARAAKRDGWRGLSRARRGWCVLATLALGPGLLVNTLLKNEWGRPRPVHLEMFGGDAPYVPVWQISDWCQSNCSFVSGEGAASAWIVAAVGLLPEPWRTWLLAPTALYAVALSANRMAFGGHFLSDLVLAWTLTFVVTTGMYVLLAPRRATRVSAPIPAVAAA